MRKMTMNPARLLDELTTVISHAAASIMTARAGKLVARTKSDLSPVTAADDAAESLIVEEVTPLLPGVPILSEESVYRSGCSPVDGDFVLVDPIDGTRELLAGRDEFTVNLALVRARQPVLGIVAAPALGLIWRAAEGCGAERICLAPGAPVDAARDRTAIRTRPCPYSAPVAIVSRSHLDPATEAFLARLPNAERVVSGSALKLCRVAEGAADIYPRLGATHEWDVAAGHAVLKEAGGTVTMPTGAVLSYGAFAEGLIVRGFIAWGDLSAARRLGV
jgi:3'(2'), 5'-bisphosphate nucleotidase